jgi:hypothetical protein
MLLLLLLGMRLLLLLAYKLHGRLVRWRSRRLHRV